MSKITHVKGARKGLLHAFIATPTYTGKVENSYLESLLNTLPLFDAAGIGYDFHLLSYNCHVDDSRNAILREFLESDATDLVFIDADVSWHPEALVRLIKHDRDVVAGVYPKRAQHDLEFPVHVDSGIELWADKDGLVEVSGAPTGFMKIKRSVVEKMVEANKHRRYTSRGLKPTDRPYTIIFERTYEEGSRWSGDYSFCRKWRKMGGKIYVDPEMQLAHKGEVEFSGTLGDHWKEKHGLAEEQKREAFNEAISAVKMGQSTPEVFLKLLKAWDNPHSPEVDTLAACYDLAKAAEGPILEAGSGLSTLVMALANPNAQIHCMEHEPIWGSRLKEALAILEIKNVTMHFGNLIETGNGKYYDTTTLPKDNFALVLCDGPPRKLGNRALLFNLPQISDAVVIMDDADDDFALAPIRKWSKEQGREVKVLGESRRFAISHKIKTEVSSAS